MPFLYWTFGSRNQVEVYMVTVLVECESFEMNIDHTHKTLTLLGHFSKSTVKSMTYKCVVIEWE